MTTNVILTRRLSSFDLLQRTSDKYFNATKFLEAFNKGTGRNKNLNDFWVNKTTKDFIEVLQKDMISNYGDSHDLKSYTTTRGNNGGTWMHPYLFMKFCFWLSPEIELMAIKFIYDNLIDFRMQAGDHYKEMCEAIATRYLEIRGEKADPLVFIEEANRLNILVFGNPKGQRNQASEEQLNLMNMLQKLNIKLINAKTQKEQRLKKLIEAKELFELMK